MNKTNYAGIDLGTSFCKFLVCDENNQEVFSDETVTKLGHGMYPENKITDESANRTLDCLIKYRQILDKYEVKPQNMRAITTATCRTAKNAPEFIKKVYDKTNIKLEVLNSEEESRLNFKGAIQDIKNKSKYAMVLDMGGGSSQITLGTNDKNSKILHWISIPWGVRNSAEFFDLVEYRPAQAQKFTDELNKHIDGFLKQAQIQKYKDITYVATSAGILGIASIVKQLGKYDPKGASGQKITIAESNTAIKKFLHQTRQEMENDEYIGKDFSYVFIASYVIFKAIYERLKVNEIVTSVKAAKDAIITEMLERDKKIR